MTTTPPEQSTLVERIEDVAHDFLRIFDKDALLQCDPELSDIAERFSRVIEKARMTFIERLSSTEDGVTEAMIEAGATAFCETLSLDPRKLARVVYLAMLKARKGL